MNIDEDKLKSLVSSVESLTRSIDSQRTEIRNKETAKVNAVNAVGKFFKDVPILDEGFTFFIGGDLYKIKRVNRSLEEYSLLKYKRDGFYVA